MKIRNSQFTPPDATQLDVQVVSCWACKLVIKRHLFLFIVCNRSCVGNTLNFIMQLRDVADHAENNVLQMLLIERSRFIFLYMTPLLTWHIAASCSANKTCKSQTLMFDLSIQRQYSSGSIQIPSSVL